MEKNVQTGWLIESTWHWPPFWLVGETEDGCRAPCWTAHRQLATVYPTEEVAEQTAWDLGLGDVYYMVEV